MRYLSDKILNRVRGHGRGKWVCTPCDFLDQGSRPAVHKTLSRLVTRGRLRRVGRGLYDWPQTCILTKQVVPPALDQAVAAITRRDGTRVIDGGMYAANHLGLTNAVQVRPIVLTDGPIRTIKVGQTTIEFKHAGTRLMQWHGRPGCPVVNALTWFGRHIATYPQNKIVARLRRQLPAHVKQDLVDGIALLPAWMADRVIQVQGASLITQDQQQVATILQLV